MVAGKSPKIIKRYSNRKLYDTSHSCYVTLDDIARMVMEGHEIQVLDNTTKKDLTAITLAHIVLEQERKKRRMPLHLLKAMVKKPSESIADFIRTGWSFRVQSLKESAERLLKSNDSFKNVPAEAQRRLDEKLSSLAEEFMANVYVSAGDLAKLNARLENLETRIQALEKTNPPPPSSLAES
ncbi:MAG: polyhydroxyalkanoate synthesis regulator DNA-binding domain-containing protein [Cystobacterineae bacterium]|nr:polyhydroxyalkanoate synthesis regulator DNA-binding domain-containing protein [Cystobacterineae bacterium]